MAIDIILNGQPRSFSGLSEPATLDRFVDSLGLKSDRVAVEQNGAIVARDRWQETTVKPGDRLEVVHFVGGGTAD